MLALMAVNGFRPHSIHKFSVFVFWWHV